jgi:hypothetical protein
MVLLALKATLMLVFLNKLVTFLEFSNRLPTQTTMFEGGGNTTSDWHKKQTTKNSDTKLYLTPILHRPESKTENLSDVI